MAQTQNSSSYNRFFDATVWGANDLPDNYIYISHMDEDLKYWRIPVTPDQITDTMESSFSPTNALGRSAPVYTYSYSGPRTITVNLSLRRDMMDTYNFGRSNADLAAGEDYVDSLVRALQAISVPKYNASNKAVEPPLVALRLAKEVFIKGIVSGSIQLTYGLPIIDNGKYASVGISFTISEVDPYDASQVYANGSFRGMVATLSKGMNYSE